jgi:hypothetical protein
MNKTEEARRNFEEGQARFRRLAQGGHVGYDDETQPPSEGEKPMVVVRGQGRSVFVLGQQIWRKIFPHATIYYNSVEGMPKPGRVRGFEVISLAMMRLLGASKGLQIRTREAQRQDANRIKGEMGATSNKSKK